MSKILPALLIGLIALAVASAQNEKPAQFQASSKLPHAVVDTHELMEIFNKSLHKDLKEKMAKAPDTPRGWKLLGRDGYRAAEIANLIMLRKPEEHGELWVELTVQAQKVGVELGDAAKKQDWPAAQAAYKAIINNCNACHQKFEPDHAPKIEE
jgi:hypothetical protein